MDTTYITILATVPFINTMALFAMVMLVAGSIGALVLNLMDSLTTSEYTMERAPLNRCLVWPIPADWTSPVAPCSYSTATTRCLQWPVPASYHQMSATPAVRKDVCSISHLEALFMDYSMDQLEEAIEVVGLLAKVQKQENVVEWVYNAPAPVVENHWAHLKEVMNEVPFMGYIGDGRLDTIMLGGLKTPVFSWASL